MSAPKRAAQPGKHRPESSSGIWAAIAFVFGLLIVFAAFGVSANTEGSGPEVTSRTRPKTSAPLAHEPDGFEPGGYCKASQLGEKYGIYVCKGSGASRHWAG